jgi:hypothetical protein
MSAPRKLPNGSWSDGVNRRYPLTTLQFWVANPFRVHVQRDDEMGVWRIFGRKVPGIHSLGPIKTHAEAIAIADKVARNERTKRA